MSWIEWIIGGIVIYLLCGIAFCRWMSATDDDIPTRDDAKVLLLVCLVWLLIVIMGVIEWVHGVITQLTFTPLVTVFLHVMTPSRLERKLFGPRREDGNPPLDEKKKLYNSSSICE